MKLHHQHRTEFLPVVLAGDPTAPPFEVHLLVGDMAVVVRTRHVPERDAGPWARWLAWLHGAAPRGMAYADVHVVTILPAQT